MAEYGVTVDGFNEKPFIEVRKAMRDRWKQFYPQADESDVAPEQQLFATIAAELADRGLEFPTESIWAALNEVYYAAYILTAAGASLDDVVAYRGMMRRPATYATTTVVTFGASGYTVPAGTIVSTQDGLEYFTTQEVTLPSSGQEAIPVRAMLPGPEYNRAAGAINRTDDPNISVSNALVEHTFTLAASGDSWRSIPNDGAEGSYQRLNIGWVGFPAHVHSLKLQVQNPTNSWVMAELQLVILDDTTGERLAKSPIKRLSIEALEVQEVTFEVGWNLLGADWIRLVVVNLPTSWGSVLVATKSTASGAGNWYERGIAQDFDLVVQIGSRGGGPATGGAAAETDAELRDRYFLGQFGGRSNAESIRSELTKLDGVLAVRIDTNPTLQTDSRGLPPLGSRITVWGGDEEEIAEAIFRTASVEFMQFVGDQVVTITDEAGQAHNIRFDRPTEVPIYLRISLVTGAHFPEDGIPRLKDALVQIIGGVDSEGREWKGMGLGTSISVDKLYGVGDNIPGIARLTIEIGRDPGALSDYVAIGEQEIARTHPSLISFR